MLKEGKYVHSEGDDNWWIPSGKVFYSPNAGDTPEQELSFAKQHFFLPHLFEDPFGSNTIVTYDKYDLLLQEITDPLGNITTVNTKDDSGNSFIGLDYRVLQPYQVTDPNGNRTSVAFDALGMVVGTAVMGKPENDPKKGDWMDSDFRPDLTQAEIDQFFADPKGPITALLLGTATNRIIYDLTGYWLELDPKKKQPAFAATLARETHAHDPVPEDGLKIQVSFSYSDGFGREIQKKIQAEPGPVPIRDTSTGLIITDANGQPEMTENSVSPRWVGSGWTIFNNKGKPVCQYEPFFTDTHRFEFDVHIGVSPILFYDPVERVIATIHPNHTYEKVVFDPWHQKTFDVNDTVASDPRTDEDIQGYVAEYFKQEATQPGGWKTWLVQRGIDSLAPPQNENGLDAEQKAAVRTLIHADTPTVAYFDSLGRTFLTVAHNKFERRENNSVIIVEDRYHTWAFLDIEGNQHAVIDAKLDPATKKGRTIMFYDYDMLSNRIHQASMEAGERWTLNDVSGKPIHAWDSRDHHFSSVYDLLRRPIESYLREGAGPELLLIGRTVYGESQPSPEAKNMRGKVYQVFDQAGVVTSDEYDFKGNLLSSRRQLATDYKNILNWSPTVEPVKLEAEIFTSSTTNDALNRPIELIAPHSDHPDAKTNTIHLTYNEASLLESVEANLQGESAVTPFVTDIDYNAKGQRTQIIYGSGATPDRQGVTTFYTYDLLTFRLIHLLTTRNAAIFPDDCPQPPLAERPGCQVQNLNYTYDPAANIIHIQDDAQQTIYFSGQVVRPDADYKYDAIYRLIEANGREHRGQAPQPQTTWNDDFRVVKQDHPNNGIAMRNYFEFYEYDEVGNIKSFNHQADKGNWVRNYEYNENSQIKEEAAARKSNRLSRTIVHPGSQQPITEPYTYDVHGNMTSMPHLPEMEWDFKDELQMVDKGGGCKVYYVYDATGQRVRKVIEDNGKRLRERIYLGGFEVYREYNGNELQTLERETLHIMDDKQRIALVETRTLGDDSAPEQLIRYQFSNHLGSASLELDEKAQIISYEEYYPYGSTSYQALDGQTEKPKRYRYTGKERDEETGLYYHGARYYAPWLGRWTEADPIGIGGDVNLYAYVHGKVLIAVDPAGLQEHLNGASGGTQAPEVKPQGMGPDITPPDAAPTVTHNNDNNPPPAPGPGEGTEGTGTGQDPNLHQLQQQEAKRQQQDVNAKEAMKKLPREMRKPGQLTPIFNENDQVSAWVYRSSPWRSEGEYYLHDTSGTRLRLVGESPTMPTASFLDLVNPASVIRMAGMLRRIVSEFAGAFRPAMLSNQMVVAATGNSVTETSALLMSSRTGQMVRSVRPGALTGINEATLVAHGVMEPGKLGASYIDLGGIYGRVTPYRMAQILVDDLNWSGDVLRLAACRTGITVNGIGTSFGQQLSQELASLGRTTAVIAPWGSVYIYGRGLGMFTGLPRVLPPATSNILSPGQGWNYYVGYF